MIFLVCLLVCVSASLALALPQDGQPFPEYDAAWTLAHTFGKAPSIGDCRGAITAPPKDSSMFFTGLRSNTDINVAKDYAEDHGLAHVSLAYPAHFTQLDAYDDSPDALEQFQKDYMQVFAEKSSGTAYLMMQDGSEPRSDSIFKTVELPAVENGAQVGKILRLSFASPPDDPTVSNMTYWTKSSDAANYATGRCNVHFTQYRIPRHGTAYSLEAKVFDNLGNEIGHQAKIDASEPVEVTSKLPSVVKITLAKPSYKLRPDDAVIQFRYRDQSWTSDDATRCSVGAYDLGDREGDCRFDC